MAELEDLLVDRAKLDRKLLTEVLAPFIGIDAEAKEVVPQSGWGRLGPDAKILVYLLARKAMRAMKSVGLEVEAAAAKEIEAATGVKGGTLRPKLIKMKTDGMLAQDKSKRYFVPTHAVLRAKEEIEGGIRNNGQRGDSARPTRGRRARRRSA